MDKLQLLWAEFSNSEAVPDFAKFDEAAADEIRKQFPRSDDDENTKARKIAAVSAKFGLGPTDKQLEELRSKLDTLSQLAEGVDAYRRREPSSNFNLAFVLLLIGLALQAWGVWPEPGNWWREVERTNASTAPESE